MREVAQILEALARAKGVEIEGTVQDLTFLDHLLNASVLLVRAVHSDFITRVNLRKVLS